GGLRRSNRANAVLVLLAVAALMVFVVISAQQPTATTPSVVSPPPAWQDLFAAAALLFVAYTGYGRIATMGEEVKNPRHVIPRAIMATVAVVTLLYVAIGWGILHYVPLTTTADFVLANLLPSGIWQQVVG